MKRIAYLLMMLWGLHATAQDMPVIDIVYNGSTAQVTIPAEASGVVLNSTLGSPNVNIYSATTTNEYRYRVTGTTKNGSLLIMGNYKLTLELAGCSITNTVGAAIDVECGKRVAVVLAAGTTNTLADGAGAQKAALYFSGHPEFEGPGTLNVTGNAKHAIAAKEYMELKEDMGTLNVLGAVSDGIHCGRGKADNANNYFEMKGGLVNITGVGSDCIDSDDYGCVKLKGGVLNLDVKADGGAGIKCDSIFKMADGQANIVLSGADAEGIRVNHTAYFKGGDISILNAGAGSKGIKLKKETTGTVLNGGFAYFEGTDVDITLTGDNYIDDSRCMGVSVDQNMALSSDDIQIKLASSQAKAYNVKGGLSITESGCLAVLGNDADVHPELYKNDMSLYFILTQDGMPIADYANLRVTATNRDGGCCGVGDVFMRAGGYTYGYMRIYSNRTDADKDVISLLVTDASNGEVVGLGEDVMFVTNASVGKPSAPIAFSPLTIGKVARMVKSMKVGEGVYKITDVESNVRRLLQR